MYTESDVALLILRLMLGGFFVFARFRWIYDPSRPDAPWFNPARRHHLEEKLCSCGYSRHPYLSGFVALTEIFGGLGVIVGLLTPLALLGLLGVLACATRCTAYAKVCEQNPVDCWDCVSCYLWRVEGIYIAVTLALLLLGPGNLSLDAVVAALVK